jgi:hypothetical protein
MFKKTVVISLVSHIAFFGFFSFSFGNRFPMADYSQISFLGQLLSNIAPEKSYKSENSPLANNGDNRVTLYALGRRSASLSTNILGPAFPNLKPHFILNLDAEKPAYIPKLPSWAPSLRQKEPSIIFHPLLPYSFPLYFKDRQTAHVELEFSIIPASKGNSIVVRRKISSGNLEVDLLSSRCISRYLFLQQSRFHPSRWQAVKIDLSLEE